MTAEKLTFGQAIAADVLGRASAPDSFVEQAKTEWVEEVGKEAPPHTLPTWDQCAIRVGNSKFIAKRVAEGGYGPEYDSLLADELHRFIHEYDEDDPIRSGWFMHRLERMLKERDERQAARCKELEEALNDAATSLETLHRLSGKTHYATGGELIETFMGTLPEIRHYALSRAGCARSALSAPKEQST
jgi:hypothetical protein